MTHPVAGQPFHPALPPVSQLVARLFPQIDSAQISVQRVELLSERDNKTVLAVSFTVAGKNTDMVFKRSPATLAGSVESRFYSSNTTCLARQRPQLYATWFHTEWQWVALEMVRPIPAPANYAMLHLVILAIARFHLSCLQHGATGTQWIPDFWAGVALREEVNQTDFYLNQLRNKPALQALVGGYNSILEMALTRLPQQVNLLRAAVHGVVHGDLHWGNTGYTQAGRLVFIDWESLKMAPLVLDLATLVETVFDFSPELEPYEDEWRANALETYFACLAGQVPSLTLEDLTQHYFLCYLWQVLDCWLWLHLAQAVAGNTKSLRAVERYLIKLARWGGQLGLLP